MFYLVLIIITCLMLYLLSNQKRELFTNVRNIPVDLNDNNRKEFLWGLNPNNKHNPLLMVNKFRKWDSNDKYRDDITTSKTSYTPDDLQKLLAPFIVKSRLEESEFVELSDGDKFKTVDYLKRVDHIVNIIQNIVLQDLFLNPNRPKQIMCPNINSCHLELISHNLVSIKTHKVLNNKKRWTLLLNIGISQKAYSYGIQCVMDDMTPVDIKVIGVMSEDKYVLKPNYNRDPKIMIASDEYMPYGGIDHYYRYNEDDSVIVGSSKEQKKMVSDYLEKQRLSISLPDLKPVDLPEDYSCYGSWGNDKVECENDYDVNFVIKPRGIWDRKCKCDSECPFYKANKNYKNEFGGCIEGKCQMPLGIKPLGNRFYDVDSKAMCYNCPIENPNCCMEQTNPDYKFEGDIYARKVAEGELAKNGLNITY